MSGSHLDYDSFWRAKTSGKSTREALGFLGMEHNVALDVSSEWVRIVEDSYWLQFDAVHGFVFDLMDSLSGKNVYVLTARRNKHLVDNQIRRLGIFGYLEAVSVVSPLNAIQEKAEQLKRLGADVFIGDTVSDAAAAKMAAVDFVGVSWGQHDGRYLLREGCGCVVNEPDELKIHLLRQRL